MGTIGWVILGIVAWVFISSKFKKRCETDPKFKGQVDEAKLRASVTVRAHTAGMAEKAAIGLGVAAELLDKGSKSLVKYVEKTADEVAKDLDKKE